MLFEHGYDLWQDDRIDELIEGLKIKLEAAHQASSGRTVNIISHLLDELLVLCSCHSIMMYFPSM